MSLRRWLVVVGCALAIAAAVGCGAVKAESKAVSPCGLVNLPVAWSPDGTQVVWYGYRWPLPPLHHRPAAISVLRAVCVADADGKHVEPLPNTVCSEHCTPNLGDGVGQFEWVQPKLILYGNDSGIYTLAVGGKPKLLTRKGAPEPFVTDSAGDRVAASGPICNGCGGPLTVLDVPSGKVVGVVGGEKLANVVPSLSPNGTKVAFARLTKSGKEKGIWTAAADGSNLRQLEPTGNDPFWSGDGSQIAYVTPSGALRLVAAQGGASSALLPKNFGSVLSWSPDGKHIAIFESKGNELGVVDVATKKVRNLLKLHSPFGSQSIRWSPDSQQLLMVWKAPAHSGCPSGLWRVPVSGATPHLVHGC
jgi:WD40 repeat protein